MSEKKLANDFWNTPDGIRSQKIFDMRDRTRRLEASNAELLDALEKLYGYAAAAEISVSALDDALAAIRKAEDISEEPDTLAKDKAYQRLNKELE